MPFFRMWLPLLVQSPFSWSFSLAFKLSQALPNPFSSFMFKFMHTGNSAGFSGCMSPLGATQFKCKFHLKKIAHEKFSFLKISPSTKHVSVQKDWVDSHWSLEVIAFITDSMLIGTELPSSRYFKIPWFKFHIK